MGVVPKMLATEGGVFTVRLALLARMHETSIDWLGCERPISLCGIRPLLPVHILACPIPPQAKFKGALTVESLKEIVRRVGRLEKGADGSYVVLKPAFGGPT